MKLYGGVEAGGTKFVCVVATDPNSPPIAELKVRTTTPDDTFGKVLSFFKGYDLKALGITSFGPVDLRRESSTYGYVTETPKEGWKHTDFARLFERTLGIPTGFDTDVNASALAEVLYGGAQGLTHVVYVTVGTGIGGGAVINGEMLHGLMHPEIGHLPVPRRPDDIYPGCCPFHGDCLEGMACGRAFDDRWKRPASSFPPNHGALEVEAYYLARAVCAIVYTISPQRIMFGGGVMEQKHLFPLIRKQAVEMLHGYLQSESITHHIDEFIAEPGLRGRSGTVGALELAVRAEADYRKPP